ncbi:MAG: hypothetical protein U0X39_13665 [Bacteroidales bacterium]
MDSFILIVAFFCGLILVFAAGKAVGHLFKLDDYLDDTRKH